MSFGLRLLEAHLFGAIWRQTKHELQILKAKENSELCFLPKEVGPCRGFSARFFFNSDSGTCEPFAVSPLRLQSSVWLPTSFYFSMGDAKPMPTIFKASRNVQSEFQITTFFYFTWLPRIYPRSYRKIIILLFPMSRIYFQVMCHWRHRVK